MRYITVSHFIVKKYRHSKLSCGCGWTLNYRVGDFHPLFYACGWTLNYRVGAKNPSIGYD